MSLGLLLEIEQAMSTYTAAHYETKWISCKGMDANAHFDNLCQTTICQARSASEQTDCHVFLVLS